MSSPVTLGDGASAIPDGSHPVQLLLQGALRPRVNTPSLILLTVHKCASAYVAYHLARVAQSAGIIPIDFDTVVYEYTDSVIAPYVSLGFLEAFRGKRTALSEPVRQEIERRIPARGFFYGAIRATPFFHHLPHFDRFRAVLMMRDPRDVLTSLFFSVAFSHGVPTGAENVRQQFLAARQKARQQGIDQYVLEFTPTYLQTYTGYCREVLGRENALLVKYEDMIRDFRAWLEQVLTFWGLPTNTRTVARVVRDADFSVSLENPHSHKRQVQAGDHQRKLQPATIRKLDEAFGDVLDALGYPRSSATGRDAA